MKILMMKNKRLVKVKCLNGNTVEALFVKQYLKGKMFYYEGDFIVTNNNNVEIDMDVVELVLHKPKFEYE